MHAQRQHEQAEQPLISVASPSLFCLFPCVLFQFNKDKRHHMRREEEEEEEERKKRQQNNYGMFNGYGYGMPFDQFFYDDRYDSGKGYDSNTFYDDFFHVRRMKIQTVEQRLKLNQRLARAAASVMQRASHICLFELLFLVLSPSIFCMFSLALSSTAL